MAGLSLSSMSSSSSLVVTLPATVDTQNNAVSLLMLLHIRLCSEINYVHCFPERHKVNSTWSYVPMSPTAVAVALWVSARCRGGQWSWSTGFMQVRGGGIQTCTFCSCCRLNPPTLYDYLMATLKESCLNHP